MCHIHHVSAHRSELQTLLCFKLKAAIFMNGSKTTVISKKYVIFGGAWVTSSFYDEAVIMGWMGHKIPKCR